MHSRIAHITDLHLDEVIPVKDNISTRKRLDDILKDIKKENITEVVCTGDIGQNEGISYFFEQLKTTSLSITLGNHDSFTEISKYYREGAHNNSKKLYSIRQKEHYKFIYLDSSEGIIDDQQISWLRKELISSKPIIIFVHHPIIGLNLKVDKIGRLKNREEILFILEHLSNEVTIFCGHYHMESEVIYKNITQYITPAVSYQIEKEPNIIKINTTIFGYRIIELSRDHKSSKIKNLSDAN